MNERHVSVPDVRQTAVKNYLLTCGHHSMSLVNNVSDWWSTFVFVETDLLLINF